jgi:hypothetical protein
MFDLLYERLEGQIYYFLDAAQHAAKQTNVGFQFTGLRRHPPPGAA